MPCSLPQGRTEGLPEGCFPAARRRYGGIHWSCAVGKRSGHTGGYLGKPQYSFQSGAGADLLPPRSPAPPGSRLNVSVVAETPVTANVSERKAYSDRLPLRLYASQPDHPQPAGRACREKPAFQRKAHAHGTAYHPGEAHVLFFRRSPAFGEIQNRYLSKMPARTTCWKVWRRP